MNISVSNTNSENIIFESRFRLIVTNMNQITCYEKNWPVLWISIKTMKIKSIFLLVNSREDVSVRWSYDVYIAAQRMFSTQTISIQTRSVCIHNRNTTFFNHLPIIRQSTTICWIIIIGHWIRIACREMSDYGAKYFVCFFLLSVPQNERNIY